MRIAMIHYSGLPVLGGVEVVIDAHARLFANAGHDVRLLCMRGGTAAEGVSLRRLAPGDSEITVAARMAEVHPLLADVDLVLIHNVATMHFDLSLTEALWELAFELPKVRFLAWVHDVVAANPDYDLPSRDERPMMLLRSAHPCWEYIAVSELRAREWAEVSGHPLNQIQVIPNGVDPAAVLGLTKKIQALAETYDLWARDLILFHPARLLQRKNFEFGFAVTAALRERGLKVAYMMTGPADSHNPSTVDFARRLDHERRLLSLNDEVISLADEPVSDADLRSLYQIADALFFPSRQEGFGLPMLEAALHRIPAFCADIEPLRDFPGALPFSLSLSPEAIAEYLMQHFASWPANPPRRTVLRSFTWSAIYRNNLAPLIATRNNSHQHDETLGR